MNEKLICTRRRLLFHASIALGTTAACAGGNGSSTEAEAFGSVSAGNVTDMPVGALRAVDGAPVLLGRDAKGLYAMTSTCTHEGCDMIADGRVSGNGVVCSCHGSTFDLNGNVTHGPATEPLAHFEVNVDAMGNVTVEGTKKVGASTRTAVA
jgi:Rieske Fe-S protein